MAGCLLLVCIFIVTSNAQTLNDIFTSTTFEVIANISGSFTEGPVWRASTNTLLFSDIPGNKIYELVVNSRALNVYRNNSSNSNGLVFDSQGRLYACEHGNRRVSRTELGGQITSIASTYQNDRLNSPNDLAVFSDGSIYFTDPPYGIPANQQELPFNGVFRIHTNGTLEVLLTDFNRPNGIIFSPEYSTLYIADTANNHIRAFDVAADGSISNGRVFVPSVGNPDGIKVDVQGNLYVSSNAGLAVYAPNGTRIGVVPSPPCSGACYPSNVCFGDADFKGVYVTARQYVYRLQGKIAGNPTNGIPASQGQSSSSQGQESSSQQLPSSNTDTSVEESSDASALASFFFLVLLSSL